MKYFALLVSVVPLVICGCRQTPGLPEQHEPAFATDEFVSNAANDVSEVKSSFLEKATDFKSAAKKEVSGFKDELSDFTNDQFEPPE